jgi:hypothetical protein
MSFRRKRDKWDEFLKQYGPELRPCGVPDSITYDRRRFLVFVDHGYDRDALFSPDLMTPGQAVQLATLIVQHFGEQAGSDLLRDLRQRAKSAERSRACFSPPQTRK